MADNVQLRMKGYNPPDASSLGNVEPYGDMSNLSPTTMVLNYLKAKGYQLNTENVRRTLEESARNPDLIPGLRNEAPPSADQQGGASGNKPSVASKVEGGGRAIDSGTWDTPMPPEGASPGGSPTTSAQPSGGLDVGNIGQAIAAGLAAGGLGAGASYLAANRGGPNYSLGMNDPGVSANVPQPGGDGGRYDVLPPPEPSPFDIAMQRAVQPATGAPTLGGSAPTDSDLAAVLNSGRLPPGVSPIDAINSGQGVQGVTGSSMPGPNEGNIPLPKRKVTIEEIGPHVSPKPPAPKFWLPR